MHLEGILPKKKGNINQEGEPEKQGHGSTSSSKKKGVFCAD